MIRRPLLLVVGPSHDNDHGVGSIHFSEVPLFVIVAQAALHFPAARQKAAAEDGPGLFPEKWEKTCAGGMHSPGTAGKAVISAGTRHRAKEKSGSQTGLDESRRRPSALAGTLFCEYG